MKGLKSRRKFTLYILLLLFLIVVYQFQQQVKIVKEPPSDKWGKENYISSGNITKNMRVIKYGDNYVALHNDDSNYKLILFDYLGNVIKKKEIESDDKSEIYNFALNVKDDFIYVNATTFGKAIELKTFKLDKKLEIISTKKVKKSQYLDSIDENIFMTSNRNNIDIHDYKKGEIKNIEVPLGLNKVMGIEMNDQYLIVYRGSDEWFYYFTYNNGKISEMKPFFEENHGTMFEYSHPVLATDNNNFYFIIERKRKGGYDRSLITQVDIHSGNISKYDFENFLMINSKGFYSQDGGRFIYTSPYTKQVVDMVIKDGRVIEKNNISRLSSLNINSYLCDDIAVFSSFKGTDFYNVYVSSAGKEYKNNNNILRKVDIKMAAEEHSKGLLNVITYIFLIGTTWFIPLFSVACIYSIISFRLVKKNKVKSYLIFSLIGILFTTFEVYNYYYSSSLIHYGILQNPIIGILASVIISASIYGYYLYKYNKDTQGLFVQRFLPPLILDTLLILILFVPFAL